MRIGTHTPWGAAETVTPLDRGAVVVTTPSHGGIWLPPQLACWMPEEVVAASHLKSRKFWEEDCDAAWPVVLLKLGSTEAQARALSFLTSYKPELLLSLATWKIA